MATASGRCVQECSDDCNDTLSNQALDLDSVPRCDVMSVLH